MDTNVCVLKQEQQNSLCANKQSTALEITSTLSDIFHARGRENINVPLPEFEQAFSSTEIGRYSHERFLVPLKDQNHQCASSDGRINSTLDYNYYMGPLQITTFE
jgi:hypothetical protein